MQVLTPAGYKLASALAAGDVVCAFDAATGSPITNVVESVDLLDYAEWCRRWSVDEGGVPSFDWIVVNETMYLFREQSVWRNGVNVCHARDLVAGDVIYDDADSAITINSVTTAEDRERAWYRFNISGDHSYIVDGVSVHNASRFWVGGTGTWDSSSTTHWASSSNGTSGQSVPGSSDDVTFDASSGGGTATLNFGGTVSINTLTMGAFTGTFDNSVNNNNFSIGNASGNVFNISGTGARTVKLGSATYTVTGTAATIACGTTNNMTFTGSSATFTFSGSSSGQRTFQGGNLTFGTLNVAANSSGGYTTISGDNTYSAINPTAPCYIEVQNSLTISNAVTWAGTSSSLISLFTNSVASQRTVNFAASSTLQWFGLRGISCTGSPVATNSFNLGNNAGITVSAPSSGGGSLAAAPIVIARGTPY